jgi:hypothetical protein
MKKIAAFVILVFLVNCFSSCEKEINVDLADSEKKIVIEGVIESNQVPYVTISKSIGFFDKIDLGSVQYVNNAIVKIQDLSDNKTITLKEYNLDTTVGTQTFHFHIYGPDLNDPIAMSFKGQVEHTYKLSISAEGKQYESITKIPGSVGLDSLWLEPVPGMEDSLKAVKAYYNDPDTFGNAVKLETLTNRFIKTGVPEIYYTSFNSVYNDDIINGTRIPLSIDLGYNKSENYSQSEINTIGFVRKGDTVNIKWSAIDTHVFDFWETLAFSQSSVGNPFASPTKIQSNIPGALGVWAGYGSIYYKIIDSL